jgi:hypothetical protein
VELADSQVFEAAHQVVYDTVLSLVTFDKHFCSFCPALTDATESLSSPSGALHKS